MANPTKDLIRGSKDPSTIGTYTTKGFKHEGVMNSDPVTRLNENGNKGITPQVMIENNSPVTRIVKDGVKVMEAGPGVPADYGKVKNQPQNKGKSAGNVGASNANHA